MGMLLDVSEATLTEDPRVHDVYASDLGRIEMLGPNVRFIFYVDRFHEEGSAPDHLSVAKLVMPRAVIYSAIQRTFFALGEIRPLAPLTSQRLS